MKIELHKIPICEIIKNYYSDELTGQVTGYDGRLNIRPAFQREFIYNDKQQRAVIHTIFHGFPLNVMYWVRSGDGNFEMLDGQQRTISICRYSRGDFSFGGLSYANLTDDEREAFLSYELYIYFCEGTDREKQKWFDVINIAGERLTTQESRNAIYSGSWLSSAKERFSKPNCPAKQEAEKYLKGKPIRQEYLETVIKWKAVQDGIASGDIVSEYMNIHARDKNCDDMWRYFEAVISWVKYLFPVYRNQMKGVEWGLLYNAYSGKKLKPEELEPEIQKLMADYDVTKKAGIYEYVFDGEEKHLNIRKFPDRDKMSAYERQKGICPVCGKNFAFNEMEADHIIAWSKGGYTTPENCQMLCKSCNRKKWNI